MFNINDFKTTFDSYGGPQRLNLFVVELYGADSRFVDTRDLRFFCKTVSIPEMNLDYIQNKPNSLGIQQHMPVGMQAGSLSAQFMLDSNHNILAFFHEWMQAIYNYDYSSGSLAPNSRDRDQLPYEIGYKSEYALNMVVRFYSYFDKTQFYEFTFTDVFPISIGAIDMSWDANDSYAVLPIGFSYSSMKVSGTGTGQIVNDRSRGFGLLDFIIEAANFGQTITSTRRPRSVQDAINQYTSIKDSFSKLKSIF